MHAPVLTCAIMLCNAIWSHELRNSRQSLLILCFTNVLILSFVYVVLQYFTTRSECFWIWEQCHNGSVLWHYRMWWYVCLFILCCSVLYIYIRSIYVHVYMYMLCVCKRTRVHVCVCVCKVIVDTIAMYILSYRSSQAYKHQD